MGRWGEGVQAGEGGLLRSAGSGSLRGAVAVAVADKAGIGSLTMRSLADNRELPSFTPAG